MSRIFSDDVIKSIIAGLTRAELPKPADQPSSTPPIIINIYTQTPVKDR